jgi:hypothetical protein
VAHGRAARGRIGNRPSLRIGLSDVHRRGGAIFAPLDGALFPNSVAYMHIVTYSTLTLTVHHVSMYFLKEYLSKSRFFFDSFFGATVELEVEKRTSSEGNAAYGCVDRHSIKRKIAC